MRGDFLDGLPTGRLAIREHGAYGVPVGVLGVDCEAPFLPGSVGNASTYAYPVRHRRIPGCTIERLLFEPDPNLTPRVVEAARELVREGARLITANGGFMIRFQRAVAEAVDVPVLLSSLLQVPLLTSTLSPNGRLGIITASARSLEEPDVLEAAGIDRRHPIAVEGLEECPEFRAAYIDCVGTIDAQAVCRETVDAALRLTQRHPDVAAILMECSEGPPYSHAVQRATGLPVYDFVSMIDYFERGLRRVPFHGYY
ncbi:MAG: aspartate/glutamate racemase family protein [Solirubrobacteraceae bacterium]